VNGQSPGPGFNANWGALIEARGDQLLHGSEYAMRFVFTILLLVFVASGIGCTKTKPPDMAKFPMPGLSEAKQAIQDLRKLQAAVSIGTNQLNYDPLLISAKASCDEAERKLPDGKLKLEINEAIRAYVDASELWSRGESIYPDSPPYDQWKVKYGIKSHVKKYQDPMPMTVHWFDKNESVPIIWVYAAVHLDESARLLDSLD
jgi:hypothetical protein